MRPKKRARASKEVIFNANHFWSAMMEGVPAWLDREEAKQLLKYGYIENYEELPGRGRYSGRWQATWTEKLKKLVRRKYRREIT